MALALCTVAQYPHKVNAGLWGSSNRGIALDVREAEPPCADSLLHQLPNTVLTPHIAAFTTEAQNAVVEAVAADVKAVLEGGVAQYYANFALPGRQPAG